MFSIVIRSINAERKIQSIKALRAMYFAHVGTAMGLREAKAVADNAQEGKNPVFMKVSGNRTLADAIAAYLGVYGVVAEVREPRVLLPENVVQIARDCLMGAGHYDEANALGDYDYEGSA